MCAPPHHHHYQHHHHPTFKDRHKYTLVPGVNWRVNAGRSHSKIEISIGNTRAAALHRVALSTQASALHYCIFPATATSVFFASFYCDFPLKDVVKSETSQMQSLRNCCEATAVSALACCSLTPPTGRSTSAREDAFI